jgi:hypothetical protein
MAAKFEDADALLNAFDKVRTHVFNGTVQLAAVETVKAKFGGEVVAERPAAPAGGARPHADQLVPFGKHKGQTLAQIHATAPDYLTWASENMQAADLRQQICEFLAA